MKVRPGEPRDFERVFDLWRALVDNGHRADPRFSPVPDGREVFARWARQDWRVPGRPLPALLVAEIEGRVIICTPSAVSAYFLVTLPRGPIVDVAGTCIFG